MMKIDKLKCTKCGECTKVCPQNILSLNDKSAELLDYSKCMECGACRLNCKYDAIELTKGTGCLVAIIKEDILGITPKGTGCGCDTGGTGCC